MKSVNSVMLAEYMAKGKPVTRLEAIMLFGINNLPDAVASMRKSGMQIERTTVPMEKPAARLEKLIGYKPHPAAKMYGGVWKTSEYRLVK